MLLLHCCALCKFPLTDSQNMHDQIVRVIEGPNAPDQLHSLHCIHSLWNWLHICDACIIATWKLGLRTPLVAHNNQLPAPSLQYNIV